MSEKFHKRGSSFAYLNTILAIIAIIDLIVPVYHLSVSFLDTTESKSISVMTLSPVIATVCIIILIVFIILQFSWRKNWQNFFIAFITACPFMAVSPDDFIDHSASLSYLPTIGLSIASALGLVISAIIAYAINMNTIHTGCQNKVQTHIDNPQRELRWRSFLLWAIALFIASFSITFISMALDIEYLWLCSGILIFPAIILLIFGIIGIIINRSAIRRRWTLRQWLAPTIVAGSSLLAIIVVKILTINNYGVDTGCEYVFVKLSPSDDINLIALIDYNGKLIRTFDDTYTFT